MYTYMCVLNVYIYIYMNIYIYMYMYLFMYIKYVYVYFQFREGAAPSDGFSFQSIVSRPHSTGGYVNR
jgi:hypothetical protein